MPESRFDYVIYIRTTPEKLWEGLTSPELTRQYWAETWQESDWKPGSSWRIMIPDGRVGDAGEIVECSPGKRLVVTWENQFVPELKEEGPSRLIYELEPAGSAVKLSLSHTIERENSKLIAAVATGWPALLSSLKSLLETGEPIEETRRWPECA